MFVKVTFTVLMYVSISISLQRECNRIWLSVYPATNKNGVPEDRLRINWNLKCSDELELFSVIKLFDADPVRYDGPQQPMWIVLIGDDPIGYFNTTIIANLSPLPAGWYGNNIIPLVRGPVCFDHYIALYRRRTRLMTSCLQIQPSWMEEHSAQLGSSRIADLIIPGTHNSANFGKRIDFADYVVPYPAFQNHDVWTQLVFGIRYLDMRVDYKHGLFVVNRNHHRAQELGPILADVKWFLGLAPGEILIMDFPKFPESFADGDLHERLFQTLNDAFGELIVEFNDESNWLGPTLNDAVSSDKRLIICYGDSGTVQRHKQLWPRLPKSCVDKEISNGLFVISGNINNRNSAQQQSQNPLWAIDAGITPGLSGTEFKNCINFVITTEAIDQSWQRDGKWKQTNIILSDFFESSNLINNAIQSNIKRAKNKPLDSAPNIQPPDQHGSSNVVDLKRHQCGKVWLTISSMLNPIQGDDDSPEKNLEINWDLNCPSGIEPPNLIKVYITNRALDPSKEPTLIIAPKDHPNDYVRTDIMVSSRSVLPGGWDTGKSVVPGRHCLQYYATLCYDDQVRSTECLPIQPTWMNDHRTELGILRIGELMIPGTHNSGSYERNKLIVKDPEDDLLTQDHDIWSQLVYGIRYIDIELACTPDPPRTDNLVSAELSDNKCSINHRIMLSTVIRDVIRFLTVSTGEIIILDFSRFLEGFDDPTAHDMLIFTLLYSFRRFTFGFNINTSPLGPTLSNIWEKGRRLIICYNNKDMLKKYNWLWPSVRYPLDVQYEPYDLINFLNNGPKGVPKPEGNDSPLWAVLAALSPTPLDMVRTPGGGYNLEANMINRELSAIFQNKWCQGTNVVATDFFLGNNIIDISIMCNRLNAFTAAMKSTFRSTVSN